MTAGDPPSDPHHDRQEAHGSELRAFLDRIRAGDEQAARVARPVRGPGPARGPAPASQAAAVAVRFAGLPPERLGAASSCDCARARSSSRTRVTSSTFLAQVARNKVIDQYRRAASRKHDIHREEPLWIGGSPPRELVADQDTASELAEADEAFGRLRDLLPDDRREILELKAEGLSSREIGERLGLSERTVRRALEDLRRRAEASDRTED